LQIPFVSVVIPVGRPEAVISCLSRLARQSYSHDRFEVLLSFSRCVPKQLPVVPFPLRIFRCSKVGSYAARNLAVEQAKRSVLAFTDDDCLPDERWLSTGVNFISGDLGERSGPWYVGGRISVYPDDPNQVRASEEYDALVYFRQEYYVRSCSFATTANMFTDMSTFGRVGHFNETLMSGADAEWGKRVSQLGGRGQFCPEANVFHPARRLLRILHKTRRVAGGIVQRDYAQYGANRTLSMALTFVKHTQASSFSRDCSLIARRHSYRTTRFYRLFAIAVSCALVRAAETVKIMCGGKPISGDHE
jgi:glycosyltransferase involved in cell wall biosynthesis